MRQNLCAQQFVVLPVYLTQTIASKNNNLEVEYGEFKLIFSQSDTIPHGSRLRVVGRISEGTQCDRVAFIPLKIQSFSSFSENEYSSFYLPKTFLSWLEEKVNLFRMEYQIQVYRFLPPQEAALLLGMSAGVKPPRTQSIAAAMQLAGLTHVLVASGANIAILIHFLRAVMRRFLSRKRLIYLSIIIATLYMFIVGKQAPIERAWAMLLVACIAQLSGRRIPWFYPLGLSAILLLIYQPFLIFSLSYWLTVLATLGISTYERVQEESSDEHTSSLLSELRDTIVSSFFVFLWTFPALVLVLGKFNVATILSGVFLLWLVEPITVYGLLLLCGTVVLPPLLFGLLSLPLWLFLSVFVGMVNLFTSLSIFETTVSFSSVLGYILYYVTLSGWFLWRLAIKEHER